MPNHKRDHDFDFVHDMSVKDMDVLDIFKYGVEKTVAVYSYMDGIYLHPNEWFIGFKSDKMSNHFPNGPST